MRAREAPTDTEQLAPWDHPAPKALDVFTREQLDEFLALIRDGIPRGVAAKRIGSTGTQMRALSRPDRDPEFAAEYAAAEAEGREFYPDRLQAEARTRALGGSDRMLEVELATHVEQYGHLRRDRLRHEGTILHEHAVVLDLSPARLDALPIEQRRQLLELLKALDAAEPTGPLELEPARDAA